MIFHIKALTAMTRTALKSFQAKSDTTNNHRTGLVIFHIKALSAVIRTTLKNFQAKSDTTNNHGTG